MQLKCSEEDILRRLLSVHNLDRRVDSEKIRSLFDGVAFHVPRIESLGIALAARAEGVTSSQLEELESEGSLLRTLSIRGSPRAIRTEDRDVFNGSMAPIDDEEVLGIIGEAAVLLTPLGLPVSSLLDLVREVLLYTLRNATSLKVSLEKTLAKEVSPRLPTALQEVWNWPSSLYQGETLGESLTRFLFPVAALSLPVRLKYQSKGNGYLHFVTEVPEVKNEQDLVRRYLHAFGPADTESFARWCGISFAQAHRLWSCLPAEGLVEVSCRGKDGWMLESDVKQMGDIGDAQGVRLLGPDDPLLKMPVRSLLVHGKSCHTYFFRSDHSPGMVLADGVCVAGWRMRMKLRGWTLVVEDIGEPLGRVAIDELAREAERISLAIGLPCDGVSIAKDF